MRKIIECLLILVLCAVLLPIADAKVIDERIYILPLGDVDSKAVGVVKDKLPGLLPITAKAEILPKEELPEAAYDPSRKQYSAEAILAYVSGKIVLDKSVECALAIVDADIYSQGTDFVFGASAPSKAIAVVSIARLRNEFYSLKPDNALFLERVAKEALHQLGCVMRLKYCPDRRCVMSLSNDIKALDKARCIYCPECKSTLYSNCTAPIFKGKLPVLK